MSADVEAVRDWVGTDVPTDLITAALARDDVDGPDRAAYVLLRRRHADLAHNRPGAWRIDGDGSETWRQDQLAALERKIARVAAVLGVADPLSTPLRSVPICTPMGTR